MGESSLEDALAKLTDAFSNDEFVTIMADVAAPTIQGAWSKALNQLNARKILH